MSMTIDELSEEARKIGDHETKEAAVAEALQEYIQRRKQVRIIELFGKIDFDPDWDPRKIRGKQ
jgi:hypothetical protein